jgi:rhodanese-related sulfurtransferase
MANPANFEEVSVETFAKRMADAGTALQLLDVREPQELAIAAVQGFQHFPLSGFEAWSPTISAQLNPDSETYVLCHHGMRSAQMCQWLLQQGFTNVKNITGGIDAYAMLVDSSIPRY